MTTSHLGETTLQAIKCLKPSGEKSFEKLTATLFSRLLGIPIRLCKSGYQAGADAFADIPIPFAIEDKRYQTGNADLNELQGKLVEAARTHHDLQLWVLATTITVGPVKALNETAENLGLTVYILDSTAAEPELPGIASIAALCASAPTMTLNAITSPDWLDQQHQDNMPPLAEVEADLRAIGALPGFITWLERLRTTLTDLPLWQLVTKRQNNRLRKILQEEARLLGTAFDPGRVVPRLAKNALNAWFERARESSEPELAVVLGERYDGKTWCVFDWLMDRLPTLPLPVFFIGSNRGRNSTKELQDHIFDDLKRVLGSFQRHAEAMIRRQRDRHAGSTPWCLMILDGLNEYEPNRQQCLDHLAWASGRTDLDVRPCVVLVTVRQQSWSAFEPHVKTQLHIVSIGPYENEEFLIALRLHGLPVDYLQTLPVQAHPMVRRPRYLGLVIDHKDQLGRYDAITPEKLF